MFETTYMKRYLDIKDFDFTQNTSIYTLIYPENG